MSPSPWLQGLGISLAFSSYRANRLLCLGTREQGMLKLHERLFDRPMGLFVAGESLWMATRCQLWRLYNLLATGRSLLSLAPPIPPPQLIPTDPLPDP